MNLCVPCVYRFLLMPAEGLRFPGNGVRGSYELPGMGPGNRNSVLCRTRMHS